MNRFILASGRDKVVRRPANRQHWTAGFSQHSLGHRTQRQPLEPTPAVSSHHDHVNGVFSRKIQDRLCCHPLFHSNHCVHASFSMDLGKFLKLFLGVLAQFAVEFAHGVRDSVLGIANNHRTHNVQQVEFSIVLSRERQAVVVSSL